MSSWFEAAAQAAGGAAAQPSFVDMMIMPLGLFAIMYFFMIRPQQRRAKDHKEFLTNMKAGDEVVTSGGIIGTIKSVADGFVSLEVSGNTSLKVMKAHISSSTRTKA
jgi:preprotein translocase subunit YajC